MLTEKQSLRLATISGIPVLVHWTFGLFVAFILFTAWNQNLAPDDAFWFVMFVCILFLFVVMHEFGHALAARRYGIETKDIIISPIGGIARLTDIPRKPGHELVVALAGPAVNVCLAILFLLILLPITSTFLPNEFSKMNFVDAPIDYLRFLLLINITLSVFNMIPAFPMDGGRVFRALLAYKMPRLKATYLAMILARVFALLFVGYGIYTSHIVLTLIGGFILFSSGSEYKHVRADYLFETKRAKDALISIPVFLNIHHTFSDVFKMKKVDQSNFPVKDINGNILGILTSPAVEYARKNKLFSENILQYISNVHGQFNGNIMLKDVFAEMDENGWYTANVLSDNSEVIGLLDRKSLEHFVQTHRI